MTTSLRLAMAPILVAAGVWLGGVSVAWGGPPYAECNGGAHCSTGWYTSLVAVRWNLDGSMNEGGCASQVYQLDTNQSGIADAELPPWSYCVGTWTEGGETHTDTARYRIKVEISDPMATGDLARPPDVNGWYTSPVGVSFSGSAFSGIASCTPATTYSGPDTLGTTVSGSCTDNAGKVAAASVGLRYDGTPPTITGAVPSRPPDYNGWYNHPVSFAFTGTDAISGIEGCSAITYAGPDSDNAQVVGSCRDRAGNVASLAVPLHYQATPPSLAADADTGDGIVSLHWQASADVEIVRSPGLNGAHTSVLYDGGAGLFRDTRVRDGVHYTYTLTAQDQAGNVTTRTLFLTPGPRLLAPSAHERLSAPPLLRWTPVRGASYYNVQLFRGGKVLSIWPAHPSLQLKRSWRFAGRHHRLKPGRYLWYVWPGFGTRAAARYGPLIGKGSFVINLGAQLSAAPERHQVARRVWTSPSWVAAFG